MTPADWMLPRASVRTHSGKQKGLEQVVAGKQNFNFIKDVCYLLDSPGALEGQDHGSQSGSSPTSQGEALEEGTAGTTAPPGTPASHVQISPRWFWEMEGPGAMLLTWKIVGLLLPTAGGPTEPGRVEPQDPSIAYPLPQPWKSPTNVTGFG